MGSPDHFDRQIHDYSICYNYRGDFWLRRIISIVKDYEFQNCFIIFQKMNPRKKVTGKERTKFYYSLAYHFLEDTEISNNIDLNLNVKKSSRNRKLCNICDPTKRKRTKRNCSLCLKFTCEIHLRNVCEKGFNT